jgi:7,8-dihydropterin-6-yl-methyl-4-(beta-D-ribofuranosyl)aminobenzene 5'-phosphate synthase
MILKNMIFGLNSRQLLIAGLLLVIIGGGFILFRPVEETPSGFLQLQSTSGSLTVLYDNYLYDSGCQTEWGYSCLVETPEMTVLFDTGGDPEILAYNIEALDIDVQAIDCIVLSHEHWDHIGGLEVILGQKPNIPVYVPGDFPYQVMSSIRSMGGECVELGNATKITDSIAVTDTLYGPPVEHSLIIKTSDGIILVTGCSHPGVQNLARNAYELTEDTVQLIIGGYHLGSATDYMLDSACDQLDEIGVECVSATHCTGDDSIQYFMDRYGENYIESGAGFRYEFV